jgi:2-keto-3-deoxy-L-rhamnonate aldolase RhmA
VPNVRNQQEAEIAVNSVKYKSVEFPNGTRRVGLGRAQNYGDGLTSYLETANNVTALILMAEHIDFVENCPLILQVGGIDAISLGPADLAVSMGLLGVPPSDPRIAKAILQIEECARNAKIPLGRSVPDRKSAESLLNQGYLLFTGPSDMETIIAAGKQFAKSSSIADDEI